MFQNLRLFFAMALAVGVCTRLANASAACPSQAELQSALDRLFKPDFSKLSIRKRYELAKSVEGRHSFSADFEPELASSAPWTQLSLAELDALNLPTDIRAGYDRATGRLRFPEAARSVLSAENGREKLSMVRIGLHSSAPWTTQNLVDHLHALQEIPDLQLLVSCNPTVFAATQERIAALPLSIRRRVRVLPSEHANTATIWAQDASKPIVSARNATLQTEGKPFARHLLDEFARRGMIEKHEGRVAFEGGNVVVGDRHVFVGVEIVDNLVDQYRISRMNALEILEGEFGKPVIPVGASEARGGALTQMDYHADLTLAVALNRKTGREVVVLGYFSEFLKGIERNPLRARASPAEAHLLELLKDPEVIRHLARRDAELEAFENTLVSQGYEVRRVPNLTYRDIPEINYTNVILSDGVALLPDYGVPQFDELATQAYESLGYRAVPMQVIRQSKDYCGGTRCLTETYRNSPPSPPTPKRRSRTKT